MDFSHWGWHFVYFEELLVLWTLLGVACWLILRYSLWHIIFSAFDLRSSRRLDWRFLFLPFVPVTTIHQFLASFSRSFYFSLQNSVSLSGLSLYNRFHFFYFSSKDEETRRIFHNKSFYTELTDRWHGRAEVDLLTRYQPRNVVSSICTGDV